VRQTLLERVCDAHVDRSPGSVVYTQFPERARRHRRRRDRHAPGRAGVPRRHRCGGDRLGSRLAAPAPARRRRCGRAARRHRCPVRDRHVGPARARTCCRPPHRDDVSAAAFPFGRGRALDVGADESGAAHHLRRRARIELYAEPGWGVQGVGTACRRRARSTGSGRVGYQPRARLSLRMEKGYRAFGSDLNRGRHAGRGGPRLLRRAGAQGRVHGCARARGAARARQRAPPAHAARRRRRLRVRLRRRGGTGRRRGGRARAQRRLRLQRPPDDRERLSPARASPRCAADGRGARGAGTRRGWQPTSCTTPENVRVPLVGRLREGRTGMADVDGGRPAALAAIGGTPIVR